MHKNITVIALGSNLGDRYQNLRTALAHLKKIIKIEDYSDIYESKALLPSEACKDWDINFLNSIIWGKTDLDVSDLLDKCNEIEARITENISEEKREKGGWAPRFIDIDIIAYNEEIIKSDKLTIPHERMLERDFVILPMADILPEWRHPLTGKTIKEYKANFKGNDIKKLELKLQ